MEMIYQPQRAKETRENYLWFDDCKIDYQIVTLYIYIYIYRLLISP